jgi:hypothetical protein
LQINTGFHCIGKFVCAVQGGLAFGVNDRQVRRWQAEGGAEGLQVLQRRRAAIRINNNIGSGIIAFGIRATRRC